MAQILTDDKYYKAIANKIRNIKGNTDTYLPSNLPTAVLSFGNIINPILSANYALAYDLYDNPIFIGDKIGNGVFCGTDITSIDLSTIAIIPKGFCADCNNLTSVKFSDNLTQIQDYAFDNCYYLTTLHFPSSLAYIGIYAFRYLGWNNNALSIVFPSSLKRIDNYAFQYSSLKEITFNEGLEEIGGWAFYNLSTASLKSIVFPATLKSIDDGAFGSNTKLTTVTFKGTPTSISKTAFNYDTAITTINVPWSESEVANAPWGATKATINYNYIGK